jgi:hypothetical protein
VLGSAEFLQLFETFERSARRLESRSHTDLANERHELEAFLAGDLPEGYPWEETDWTRMVARHAGAGHEFSRVRVMDDPLSDYNRYMIYTSSWNAAAGEDVRYLDRVDANALDLPDHDFWVFDSTRLVELRFTADGRVLGHDLVVDQDIVAQHALWLDRAFDAATTRVEYLAEDPTRAWPPARFKASKGI